MNKKVLIALLLVLIVGISAWLFYSPSGDVPKTDLDIYQALGATTAEETAKLLGNKGGIVVIGWDSGHTMPVVEAQLTAFARALKKHEGMEIIANEKVLRNPTKMMGTGEAIPAEELLKIVKAHPTAGAIVLFLAFPNLSPPELSVIGEAKTKIVVVSGCNPGYKKLLMDRNIDLAIIPRFDLAENTRSPQTVQEIFNQNYQVVTSAQAAELPH